MVDYSAPRPTPSNMLAISFSLQISGTTKCRCREFNGSQILVR
jgi:hypothetical protein